MIELNNIKKSFGKKKIMKGVSLSIKKGEKIAIIGPSGCGKSTALRIILGLMEVDSGDVLFKGEHIELMSENERRTMRMKMGMLFQSAALFDSMSVGDNVAFSLIENLKMSFDDAKERTRDVLRSVDMLGYEDAMPSELSGGQKKRIGLARAIAPEPELIFYDEPTTGLDPVLSTSIEDVIVKLNTQLNATSIIVSHQKSTILRTADKIYMMHDGQLLPPETPDTIENSSNDIIRNFINGKVA